MADSLINSDAAVSLLLQTMNKEMVAAAEPVIDKALADIEKVMREKLGSMVIAYLDNYMEVERMGNTLRILIKHDK
jgi:hypothetical protein